MQKRIFSALLILCCITTGCVRSQPEIIVITATFEPFEEKIGDNIVDTSPLPTLPPLDVSAINPTPDPLRYSPDTTLPAEHIVQPGDTLYGIAQAYNISLNTLLAVNTLPDPNVLAVGQIIKLPDTPTLQTNSFKIIPDSRLVRAPGSAAFNIQAFIAQSTGYIKTAVDVVPTNQANRSIIEETLTAAQVIERVSLEYSVDARLLLALLEYKAQWLSSPNIPDSLKVYPIISPEDSGAVDRRGLYRQLAYTANELNRGYYNWKNRGVTTLEFKDGTRLLFSPGLNAGTVGLQYFLSLNTPYTLWLSQTDQNGFFQTYARYFGNPFTDAVDPLVPSGIQQPNLTLPFSPGETWFFTGGPHGGWGSGSAWAAVDFAPPDEVQEGSPLCYTSNAWITAVAPGVIARSGGGTVVLDLDGDGDESTGWTILYLHLATQGRIETGARVNTGDRIGLASCEGGFSTATHMHIGRRYNGEWIPASCEACPPDQARPPFVMSDWRVIGLPRQEYQGYMELNNVRKIAEQGRLTTENRISW